jgi:hypothetical protein
MLLRPTAKSKNLVKSRISARIQEQVKESKTPFIFLFYPTDEMANVNYLILPSLMYEHSSATKEKQALMINMFMISKDFIAFDAYKAKGKLYNYASS